MATKISTIVLSDGAGGPLILDRDRTLVAIVAFATGGDFLEVSLDPNTSSGNPRSELVIFRAVNSSGTVEQVSSIGCRIPLSAGQRIYIHGTGTANLCFES